MGYRIRVFYHLFAVTGWRRILDAHIRCWHASGLYDACQEIRIGVVYREKAALEDLREMLGGLGKVQVSFSRVLSAGPVIWRNPEVRLTDGRFGEAETILHMTRLAQADAEDVAYLFMHSKGVTNPATRERRHFEYLVRRGLDPAASNEAANDFVLDDLASVVTDWRTHYAALEKASFSYRLFNFFWVSGRLLHGFDFADYLEAHKHKAPPQQRGHVLGRHWDTSRHLFSLFPIKLYAFTHGVELRAALRVRRRSHVSPRERRPSWRPLSVRR